MSKNLDQQINALGALRAAICRIDDDKRRIEDSIADLQQTKDELISDRDVLVQDYRDQVGDLHLRLPYRRFCRLLGIPA